MSHLIYFYSNPAPRITVWDSEEVKDVELQGEVTLQFSPEKKCVGYQTEKERKKCPYSHIGTKQCKFCTYKDISKVYTRLDMEGYEHLSEEIEHQNFSIYLALFGNSIIKCGVTRTERVERRTMEQGADFWVELMRFNSAEKAYEMEAMLQGFFGFNNAVRSDAKMKILMERKFDDIKLKNAVEIVSANEELESLVYSKAIRKNHFCTPKEFENAINMNGEIVCSKASMLFFKKDGRYYCINMKKKEGCEF